MKKSMRALLSLALCLLMCLSSSALAVQYVTFSDIPGDWNGYAASVVWMNADYTPSSANVFIDTDTMEGGEVADGVFEYMADATHAYNNPGAILAYLYIDTPAEITYVSAFEGNWESHEYMFMNCIATDGMYVDVFFPSFDKDGNLLNTDRIYLYEYEVGGEWHYECVTFYFRYDGEETRSFLPIAAEEETEDELLYEITIEESEENEEVVTEDVIITDNAAAIGIIGGADGPTSVIVSGTDSAFGTFFGNVLEGILSGAQESTATEELIEIEPDQAELIEEVTEEATEAASEKQESKIFEFFSGAFGN